MRSLVWLTMLLAGLAAAVAAVVIERNPVRTHPRASAETGNVQQFIVKLHAASTSAALSDATQLASEPARITRLAARTGLTLHAQRQMTSQMHVIRVESVAGESAAATLARLRQDPDVQYAEPDQRRYVHAITPNDPLYSGQWYLQVNASTPSAIDATDAWSTTTGSPGIVIADIDTGVRADHPDLAGRLLTGYCFISDSFIANGGDCPGSGATDPGDWITSADLSQQECSGASAEPSSWHGTRVAGILGAVTNNDTGIAGVTWSSQLLPVRALGKCGGQDSDIISGMMWAAGITVTVDINGTSTQLTNANPAQVINMSLGGTGSCPQSYQDAIDQITTKGVLIVASAGNEGGPVDAPANCSGVAAVVGLRQAGTKVGYSSLGPQVALAAPAGNCSYSFTAGESACVYTMTTTTNLGYEKPDANDYTGEYYCDPTTGGYTNCTLANSNQYRTYNLGTSFSAPLVSGIGALMIAVNSKLSSCELISRLREGTQAFPQTSLDATTQPPMCHVPANANDIQNSECICTPDDQTCGAGMANAPGALQAALRPIAAATVPSSVSAGQSVTLQGGGSAAANGHIISSYAWTHVSGQSISIQNSTTANATLTLPSCGLTTVGLTVTDNAGRQDTADVVISPTTITTTAPATATNQSSCSATTPAIQVAVCPASANVQTSKTESFAATLANTTNTAVTWQVNGVMGGDSTLGTISTSGSYTAPTAVPTPATVTISALSAADSSSSGSAQITIEAPPRSGGGGAIDWLTLLVCIVCRSVQLVSRRLCLSRWEESRNL